MCAPPHLTITISDLKSSGSGDVGKPGADGQHTMLAISLLPRQLQNQEKQLNEVSYNKFPHVLILK